MNNFTVQEKRRLIGHKKFGTLFFTYPPKIKGEVTPNRQKGPLGLTQLSQSCKKVEVAIWFLWVHFRYKAKSLQKMNHLYTMSYEEGNSHSLVETV